MKKGLIVITFVLLLSISFVSAGLLQDFLDLFKPQPQLSPQPGDVLEIWNGDTTPEARSVDTGSVVNHNAKSGTYALEGTPTQWKGLRLQPGEGGAWLEDISGYDYLEFYAKADQEGKTFDFSLVCWGCGTPKKVNIDQYIEGGSLTTTYKKVSILISDLAHTTSLQNLDFGTANPPGHKIYIDDIRAVKGDGTKSGEEPGNFGRVSAGDTISITIRGKVTELTTGRPPIPGAEVKIGEEGSPATTNGQGDYILPGEFKIVEIGGNLKTEEFEFIVTADGYKKVNQFEVIDEVHDYDANGNLRHYNFDLTKDLNAPCVPNWNNCGVWGACSVYGYPGGTQTRECKDSNNCGTCTYEGCLAPNVLEETQTCYQAPPSQTVPENTYQGLPYKFYPSLGYSHEFAGGRTILYNITNHEWLITSDGINYKQFYQSVETTGIPSNFKPTTAWYHPNDGGRVILKNAAGTAYIRSSKGEDKTIGTSDDSKFFLLADDPSTNNDNLVAGPMNIAYYQNYDAPNPFNNNIPYGDSVILENNNNAFSYDFSTQQWTSSNLGILGLPNQPADIAYYHTLGGKQEVQRWYGDRVYSNGANPLTFEDITNQITGLPRDAITNDLPIITAGYYDTVRNEIVVWEYDQAYSSTDGRIFNKVFDGSLVPQVCGNGFIEYDPVEECDDGNTANGDGCSATCEIEESGQCPAGQMLLEELIQEQLESIERTFGELTFENACYPLIEERDPGVIGWSPDNVLLSIYYPSNNYEQFRIGSRFNIGQSIEINGVDNGQLSTQELLSIIQDDLESYYTWVDLEFTFREILGQQFVVAFARYDGGQDSTLYYNMIYWLGDVENGQARLTSIYSSINANKGIELNIDEVIELELGTTGLITNYAEIFPSTLTTTSTKSSGSVTSPTIIKLPEIQDPTSISCPNGCLSDGQCYPDGRRLSGEYCDATINIFVTQLSSDTSCQNNFECASNVCSNNQCLEVGFFKKVLCFMAHPWSEENRAICNAS